MLQCLDWWYFPKEYVSDTKTQSLNTGEPLEPVHLGGNIMLFSLLKIYLPVMKNRQKQSQWMNSHFYSTNKSRISIILSMANRYMLLPILKKKKQKWRKTRKLAWKSWSIVFVLWSLAEALISWSFLLKDAQYKSLHLNHINNHFMIKIHLMMLISRNAILSKPQ